MRIQVATSYHRELGPDHPKTLKFIHSLAHAYQGAGRMDEVLELFESSAERGLATLGARHSKTLEWMSCLAQAYLDSGRLNDSVRVRNDALSTQQSAFGADHPATLLTMWQLAFALIRFGSICRSNSNHRRTVSSRSPARGLIRN